VTAVKLEQANFKLEARQKPTADPAGDDSRGRGGIHPGAGAGAAGASAAMRKGSREVQSSKFKAQGKFKAQSSDHSAATWSFDL